MLRKCKSHKGSGRERSEVETGVREVVEGETRYAVLRVVMARLAFSKTSSENNLKLF